MDHTFLDGDGVEDWRTPVGFHRILRKSPGPSSDFDFRIFWDPSPRDLHRLVVQLDSHPFHMTLLIFHLLEGAFHSPPKNLPPSNCFQSINHHHPSSSSKRSSQSLSPSIISSSPFFFSFSGQIPGKHAHLVLCFSTHQFPFAS